MSPRGVRNIRSEAGNVEFGPNTVQIAIYGCINISAPPGNEPHTQPNVIKPELPNGVTDLQGTLRDAGFDFTGSGLGNFVRFGSARLENLLEQEQRNLWQVDEFEKPNVQRRIDAAQEQIRIAQVQIASKTFLGEYTYSTSNVKNFDSDNTSSFTMKISTGFTGINSSQTAIVKFPWQDTTSEKDPSGRFDSSALLLFVEGSTNSIKELVRNSNNYRAKVVFRNLRYDNNRVEADVLGINIVPKR